MTITQAIEKAIKGGWNETWYFSHFNNNEVAFGDTGMDSENNPCHYRNKYEILFDPLFWQALFPSDGKNYSKTTCDNFGNGDINCNPTWLYHQHRLIGRLAEGKSIESFFETL